MATYNGEPFIGKQIDTLLAQTSQDWTLYVHDDGSTDATVAIVDRYAAEHPGHIIRLDYPPQGGARNNFMSLLARIDAPYYMFADQDDLWHTDKIAVSMAAMKAEEQLHPDKAVVVHSDLRLVDNNGNTIHPSFFSYANLHPERITAYGDYIQNIVTGCTMLFNRQARTAALSRPYQAATMHDAWITLRTIADGGIRHTIYEPLTDYRQHGDNVMGAEDGHRFTLAYRLTHAADMARKNLAHYRMMKQAGSISLPAFVKAKTTFFMNR
jgi:glycosyltransferase involved in cell wall biosynthesis